MFLPPRIALFLRVFGLFFAVSLLISPWIVTLESNDPFLSQSWILLGQSCLALGIMSVLFLFWTPRKSQLPLALPLGLLWCILTISAFQSAYVDGLWWCLIGGALSIHLMFFRLALKPRDAVVLGWLVVFSGALMSVLGLCQAFGLDILVWKVARVVGTLANPNFFGAYIMGALLISLGFLLYVPSGRVATGFLVMAILLQVLVLRQCGVFSPLVGLSLGLVLFATSVWERPTRRFTRWSAFSRGALVTGMLVVVMLGLNWTIGLFPWDGVKVPPYHYFSLVTRLLLFQMGFALFAQNPLGGMGLGSNPYLLAGLRPRLGTVLGLSTFNNDPHSVFIHLLSETGLLGLFAFCCVLSAFWGVHSWRFRRFSSEPAPGPAEETTPPVGEEREVSGNTIVPPRLYAVPLLVFLVHGGFNNTFTVVPLVIFIMLLGAFHQALCLRETRWKRRFSVLLLPYLLLPVFWAILCWSGQTTRHFEEKGLFLGQHLLKERDYFGAARVFEEVLRRNFQSIQGLWGLAAAFEGQSKEGKAEEVLNLLDKMAPKVMRVRFHLARLLLDQGKILDAHRWALLNLEGDRSPSSHWLLGTILLQEGRIEDAADQFARSVQLVPRWIAPELEAADTSRLHLARINFDRGKVKAMGSDLRKIHAPAVKGSPEFAFLQGLYEYKQRKTSAALGWLEKALNADPGSSRYANALGFVLVESGTDLARGTAILESAFRKLKAMSAPPTAEVLSVAHSLGTAYRQQGDLPRAKELLNLAYQQTPLEQAALKASRRKDLDLLIAELEKPAVLAPKE